jgi:hypothetical protein
LHSFASITKWMRMVLRNEVVVSSLALFILFVAIFAACSSNDADCITNVDGTVSCTGYADAYPYDYAYAGYDTGYYPYTLTVYDEPAGYDVTYGSVILGGVGTDAGPSNADAGAGKGPPLPELIDKARKAANAINAGIRTTLDPIRDITKTAPAIGDNVLTYGPMDRGQATYRFTLRRFSAAEKRYGWALEARPAGTTGSFLLVAGSTIQIGATPRRGSGVLGADYDAQSSVDPSVTARGKLLLGFADDATTKTLRYNLDGYTPNPAKIDPVDAKVIGWHELGQASSMRVVAKTNLAETQTTAPEIVAIKVRWIRGVGARADAVATNGDIPQGSALFASTCVPPSLDRQDASTSSKLCSGSGEDCTLQITCPNDLMTADEPNADPEANDPPAGIPAAPEPPTTVPTGT